MLTLILRQLKDRRNSMIAYSVGSIAFLWMYVGMYPSMMKKADEFNKLMDAYPENLMKAFGVESAAAIFSSLENFIALEHYSIIWPIMLFAMLIAWGGASIAGEIEKGTIELLLTQPLSRLKIFLAKYISGVIGLFIFVILTVFSVFPLAGMYDLKVESENHLKIALLGLLLGLTVLSIATFFSAIFSEKGRAYFATSSILVIMYVLNIFSSLKEDYADLKYLSYFYYFDHNSALIENHLKLESYWVFLGSIIIFTTLAAIIFSRRDVAV